jgi:hypothetical protein
VRGDKTISENVKTIIEMSGNTQEYIGEQQTGSGALTRYTEKTSGEQYMFDVIDGRSFRSPDLNSRLTVGELYKIAGLQRMRPAPIQPIETTIPIIKELMRIDPEMRHYERKTQGAPKLYVFRTCPNVIKDIKGYRNKEDHSRNGVISEKPHSKNDHTLDALRYGVMMNPHYISSKPYKTTGENSDKKERTYWIKPLEDMHNPGVGRRRGDKFTGY